MKKFCIFLLASSLLGICSVVHAEQIKHDMFSSTGGPLNGAAYSLTKTNMLPYNSVFFGVPNEGHRLYEEGMTFIESLSLVSSTDPRIINYLKVYRDADYGSVTPSFISQFDTEVKGTFLAARDFFIDGALAGNPVFIEMLNNCMKAMVEIYIIFGDEYFIDSLDYKIFSNLPDIDGKLNKRKEKMDKAVGQYSFAVQAAVDWMTPATGNSNSPYLGSFFGQGEYDIFNLACERLSMAMTELSSLEYLANIAPDPSYEWAEAKTAFKEELSGAATEAYIQSAALSDVNQDFINRGIGLIQNFDILQTKGAIATNDLNILGYDDRFVPIAGFSGENGLYDSALNKVLFAKNSEQIALNDSRNYDSLVGQLQNEINSMYGSYVSQLQIMTGVNLPINPDQTTNEALLAVSEAGYNLLKDCPIDELEAESFESCMAGNTGGSLTNKYRQWQQAELRVELALQERLQIKERIEMAQARLHEDIELISNRFTNHSMTLREFAEKLIQAQSTSRTKVQINTKKYDPVDHEWKRDEKITRSERVIEFDPSSILINLDQEIALLDLQKNNEIEILKADNADAIKKMMMELENSLIQVRIAAQEVDVISTDFLNTIVQKNNLLSMYLNAGNHMAYVEDNMLTARIIKASSVINARVDLDEAKRWTYLAAKAFEYKFLRSIHNLETLSGQPISIDSIFKAQSVYDLEKFLYDLDDADGLMCAETNFSTEMFSLSLTNDNDIPDISTYTDENGFKVYEFSTTAIDKAFNPYLTGFTRWNVKNWAGTISPCGESLPNQEYYGFSVHIRHQASNPVHLYCKIIYEGPYTFIDEYENLKEYQQMKASRFIYDSGSSNMSLPPVYVLNPKINDAPQDPNQSIWVGDLKGRGIGAKWKLTIGCIVDDFHKKLEDSEILDVQLLMYTVGNPL